MRDRRITAFALELVPRITRAQSIDALKFTGDTCRIHCGNSRCRQLYKVLADVTHCRRTIRPATVLILGAGVTALWRSPPQSGLAQLLRPMMYGKVPGEQVRSLGAKFLELGSNAERAGGYARKLTPKRRRKRGAGWVVRAAVAKADIVITTASIQSRKAPRLVTRETVATIRPGAVIGNLAAESGGNCELTVAGKTVREHGVTIIGPQNLPARVPFHCEPDVPKNLQSFLSLLVDKDGALVKEFTDEILVSSLLVHAGEVRHGPTRDLLGGGKP